jgi:copper chaperone CopZ
VVKRALEGLPGVRQADVSLEAGTARVVYDGSVVTIERMIQAVSEAGFLARPLSTP